MSQFLPACHSIWARKGAQRGSKGCNPVSSLGHGPAIVLSGPLRHSSPGAGRSDRPEAETEGLQLVIIALDGPAASGKGTLAKALAARYGLPHLDTGLLYRATARAWVPFAAANDAEQQAVAAARAVKTNALDAKLLATPEISEYASRVAAIPAVRAALFQLQRDFANQAGGAVLDGRDIGTVVAPQADVKLFVTASPEARARRRAAQYRAEGQPTTFEEVLADIKKRDARDMGRADAPLRAAPDAHLLDTSEMDIETALRAAIAIVERARAGGSGA